MARCVTCGAELAEDSERFCGGDRCRRVLMKPAFRQEVGDEMAPGVLQREAGNLGALRH
jgi:hypothetical protein